MLFGGASHKWMNIDALNDCVQYSNKRRVWRMIHANNAASPRLGSAMCQMRGLIAL